MAVVRVMVDSNITDRLISDPARAQCAQRLHEAGLLDLLRMYPQEDEHKATPDERRREELLAALNAATLYLPGRGSLLLTLVGPHRGAKYGALRQAGLTEKDAIIAANADESADWLVTEDRKMRRRAAPLIGSTVMDWDEFAKRLDEMEADLSGSTRNSKDQPMT